MGTIRRTRTTWAGLLFVGFLLSGAGGGLGESKYEWEVGESVSDQTQQCGHGTWYAGEQRAFDHSVAFSVSVDSDRGFVTDCYTGTDAFLEYQGYYAGDVYVYTVWGQLGDYA